MSIRVTETFRAGLTSWRFLAWVGEEEDRVMYNVTYSGSGHKPSTIEMGPTAESRWHRITNSTEVTLFGSDRRRNKPYIKSLDGPSLDVLARAWVGAARGIGIKLPQATYRWPHAVEDSSALTEASEDLAWTLELASRVAGATVELTTAGENGWTLRILHGSTWDTYSVRTEVRRSDGHPTAKVLLGVDEDHLVCRFAPAEDRDPRRLSLQMGVVLVAHLTKDAVHGA